MDWKLAYMLVTYRTCNSIVEFSKYEFNNNLLGDVILVRVILYVTWTQSFKNILYNFVIYFFFFFVDFLK